MKTVIKSFGIAVAMLAMVSTTKASINMNAFTFNSGNPSTLGAVFIDTVGGTPAGSTVKVDFLFGATAGNLDHSSGVFTLVTANQGFLNDSPFAVTTLTAGGAATLFGGQSGFYQMRAWTGGATFSDVANTKTGSSAVTGVSFGGLNSAGTQTFGPVDLNLHANFAITSVVVPEPATIALGLFGAAGLLIRRRK